MIFITAKFHVRPEDADRWPQIAGEFTRGDARRAGLPVVRLVAQPRRPDGVRARRGVPRRRRRRAHVQSEHFQAAQRTLPPHLVETPRIVNATIPQDDWSRLGELAVPEA